MHSTLKTYLKRLQPEADPKCNDCPAADTHYGYCGVDDSDIGSFLWEKVGSPDRCPRRLNDVH